MLQTKLVFSCGVLRGVVPHGAPDDGDGELHGGLPHRALAGHGDILLALAGSHQQPRHTARPRMLQVQHTLDMHNIFDDGNITCISAYLGTINMQFAYTT